MVDRFGKDTRVKIVGGEIHFRFRDESRIEFVDTLERLGVAAGDFKPVFAKFGAYMLRSIDRTFRAQGRPQRWKGLAASTIRERLRLGYGAGPILQRSGKLRRGFKTDYGPRSFRLWNTVYYFVYHQSDKPRKRLPRRVMVQLLRQDRAQFTKYARQHLGLEQ